VGGGVRSVSHPANTIKNQKPKQKKQKKAHKLYTQQTNRQNRKIYHVWWWSWRMSVQNDALNDISTGVLGICHFFFVFVQISF
jgi:hypothetical protein